MSNPLTGKVALVTGGSRGIGAAIAARLARDGAAVAITYVSSPGKAEEVVAAIAAAGGKAIAIQADSADAAAVQAAVRETVDTLGGIDILVNNAGVGILGPLDTFTLDDFDKLVAVNIRAVFVASQEAARHMGKGGRIITIGSCMAERVVFPGGGPYAMTKAAVVGLTRGLARDLGPRGITVNTVQPGPIDTDMNPANGPHADALLTTLALGRYGDVSDIASITAFLAGPEAGYITGASLTVDGGYAV